MKILVTGCKGQLGCEIKKISTNYDFEWIFSDRCLFDFYDLDNISFFLDNHNPEIIINCAAYTSVDDAEDNFVLANTINHKAVSIIAKWCNYNKCKLLHISTDYVYDGNSLLPYVETDETNPLNNYGKSKLLGDIACQKNNPYCIIIRTSWLYSSFGNNFLTKIINAMKNNDEINVIYDQFGSPTYAGDLANTIIDLIINKEWRPGVYNFTNNGIVSRHNFAKEIKSICGFRTIIKPISTKVYAQRAKRPKYSLLNNSKIISTFNIKQIDYLESLKKCIKILKNGS